MRRLGRKEGGRVAALRSTQPRSAANEAECEIEGLTQFDVANNGVSSISMQLTEVVKAPSCDT